MWFKYSTVAHFKRSRENDKCFIDFLTSLEMEDSKFNFHNSIFPNCVILYVENKSVYISKEMFIDWKTQRVIDFVKKLKGSSSVSMSRHGNSAGALKSQCAYSTNEKHVGKIQKFGGKLKRNTIKESLK